MPRILYAAARDRVIPSKALANIHPVFRTPHIAVIIYAFLGFIFASAGEFKQLAMLSSASYILIYLGVVLSVVKYRIMSGDGHGSIKTILGYSIPVISAIAMLWVLSNLQARELLAMVIFILLLSVIYLFIRFYGKRPVAGR